MRPRPRRLGCRLVLALRSAVCVSFYGMISLIAQPTTLREIRSMMTAKASSFEINEEIML